MMRRVWCLSARSDVVLQFSAALTMYDLRFAVLSTFEIGFLIVLLVALTGLTD
jgi:hypothetical protein